MEKIIKEILDDILKSSEIIDDKEKNLEKIISKMINLKPEIKADENFKNTLKDKIMQKITEDKIKNYRKSPSIIKIISLVFGSVGVASIAIFIFTTQFSYLYTKPSIKTITVQTENTKMLKKISVDEINNSSGITLLGNEEIELYNDIEKKQAPLVTIQGNGGDVKITNVTTYTEEKIDNKEKLKANKNTSIENKSQNQDENQIQTDESYDLSDIGSDILGGGNTEITADEAPVMMMALPPNLEKKAEYTLSGSIDFNSLDKNLCETNIDNILKILNLEIFYTNSELKILTIKEIIDEDTNKYLILENDNHDIIKIPLLKELYNYDENNNIIGKK